MARKTRRKLANKAGSLGEKPPWMKYKTFEKIREKHFDYYEEKFKNALYNELVKYFPNQRHMIEKI